MTKTKNGVEPDGPGFRYVSVQPYLKRTLGWTLEDPFAPVWRPGSEYRFPRVSTE